MGVGLDKSLSIITGHLVGGVGTGQPKDGIEAGDGARGLQASSLRERRISRSLDVTAVEQWAREGEYWDDIKKVIEVVDEDNLVKFAWEHKDQSDIVTAFYVEKETWAFKA